MTLSRQQRRAASRGRPGPGRSHGVRRTPMIGAIVGLAAALGALAWLALGGRGPARDGAPSWSPDGSEIVFYSAGGGAADLYAIRPDGTGLRRITRTRADEGAPAWSPDRRRLAYDSDVDGNYEIYVANADGSSPVRLTDAPGRDVAPAWSPDGTKIAFMSDRVSRPEFDVFMMNADGSHVERVSTSGTSWFPQYSPDGTRLAFHVGRDVHVLDLTTTALTRLTTFPQDGMYPSWSPDGRRIAFMTSRLGAMQIFTMNADGTDQRPLVRMPAGSAIDPRWSPDGERLVFVHVPETTPTADQHADMERAIYVLEIASGRLTRLSR